MSEIKKFYRVCHEVTMQGLWYDSEGDFTGLIHNDFYFCKNASLEMDFDNELIGWLSAVESLENLYFWFPEEDIKELQEHGFYIFEYEATEWKLYERFNHTVINKNTSRHSKKIILL